jgi:DNA/RNA endonuclease YhcR with UshA esterase domain
MKTFFLSIILALSFRVQAQEIPKITPDQAKDYIGKTVTVCGEVKDSYVAPKSGTIFLNFGADYPNQIFVAYIYEDAAKNFPESPATAFKGKNICVTGEVKMFQEKPEIMITKPEQIKL